MRVRVRVSAAPCSAATHHNNNNNRRVFRLAPQSRSGKTHSGSAAGGGKQRLPPFSQAGPAQQTGQTPSRDARTARAAAPTQRNAALTCGRRQAARTARRRRTTALNNVSATAAPAVRSRGHCPLPLPPVLPPVAPPKSAVVSAPDPPSPWPPLRYLCPTLHEPPPPPLLRGAGASSSSSSSSVVASHGAASTERDRDNGGNDVPQCTVCAVYLPVGVCVWQLKWLWVGAQPGTLSGCPQCADVRYSKEDTVHSSVCKP